MGLDNNIENSVEETSWELDFLLRNKKESTEIRKRYRRSKSYKCCHCPVGNAQKFSGGYCCTYPQTYRRRDITVQNKRICRNMDDDVYFD